MQRILEKELGGELGKIGEVALGHGCQFFEVFGERPTWSSEGRVGKEIVRLYCSAGSRLIDDVMNKETTTYNQGLLDP